MIALCNKFCILASTVRLAQLVERYIDIVEVTSSSLVPDTIHREKNEYMEFLTTLFCIIMHKDVLQVLE